jgi:regulator of sirC expression with transglutaminase-like and TPR domain
MPTTHLDYFSSLVAEDAHFPLQRLHIAVGQHAIPDLDVQAIMDDIDLMVTKLQQRLSPESTALQKLQHLKHFFFNECVLV